MRIRMLMRAIGPGNEAYEIGHLPVPGNISRESAAEIAEEKVTAFHYHGYNAEHDYWWGRNVGDPETAIFVLTDV